MTSSICMSVDAILLAAFCNHLPPEEFSNGCEGCPDSCGIAAPHMVQLHASGARRDALHERARFLLQKTLNHACTCISAATPCSRLPAVRPRLGG